MKRFFTALTAIAFVVALGGASIIQPAQSASKAATKSAQKSKGTTTAKGSTAGQPVLLNRLAMRSTCRSAGVKQGLRGSQLWDYIGNCARS
jgi:ABC-type phosphate transport system substrate-binding protein